MLKLTIEAGEYVMIGNDIKVVFTGGTSHHARVLINAPKTYKIVRSRALEKRGLHIDENTPIRYKKEREISSEAKEQIQAILAKEYRRKKLEEQKQR